MQKNSPGTPGEWEKKRKALVKKPDEVKLNDIDNDNTGKVKPMPGNVDTVAGDENKKVNNPDCPEGKFARHNG